MVARKVAIALATYTDPEGGRRIGQQGEQIDVADSDLSRFDAVNGGAPASAPKRPAPKKRAPRK